MRIHEGAGLRVTMRNRLACMYIDTQFRYTTTASLRGTLGGLQAACARACGRKGGSRRHSGMGPRWSAPPTAMDQQDYHMFFITIKIAAAPPRRGTLVAKNCKRTCACVRTPTLAVHGGGEHWEGEAVRPN